tara:strand:+ start:1510 stop:2139 length:630 start_codon:yes stop_codon:yes gene_type:complete
VGNGSWIRKAIAEGGIKAIAFYVFTKVLLPVRMPMMTIVMGYASGAPWFYIWIGFLASLAFVFHWLLKMNEWMFKIKVKDKIALAGLFPFFDVDGKHGVQLQLASLAEFPIDFRVENFDFRLGGRVPEDEQVFSSTIPPHGKGWKNSGTVDIDVNENKPITGTLKYSIEYGRNKTFNNVLDGNISLSFIRNENGEYHLSWGQGEAHEQG